MSALATGLGLVMGGGALERCAADSKVRIGRESESSETAWSVQVREEEFELYWNGLVGAEDTAFEVPGPGFMLRSSAAALSVGGLRGISPQALGRRLSVFSLDVEGNAPGVGPGANAEGFSCELGDERGGGFVCIARNEEGTVRKQAFVHTPIRGGRTRLCAGAFGAEGGLREISWGARSAALDMMVSTGETTLGPETSVSIREKDRCAAVRATWRDGPEGRVFTLACGAGVSRGRFSATRVEISGSPWAGSATKDSRARGVLRSVWGPWRIFAGADARRLTGGESKIRGSLGFTKVVTTGIFATTDFEWETTERRTPGTASFTLAGRLASFTGSLQSEVSASTGRRVSISLERGRKIRSRVALRLADRVRANPRAALEITVTRVD